MRIRTLALAAALAAAAAPAQAQAPARAPLGDADLRGVFPLARRFSEKRGSPPAYEAYRADPAGRDSLAGWVFLTSDVPPEAQGYSGTIEALVGLDLSGALTGIRVLEYHESLRSSRGDFLAEPGFQEQFAGKPIADAFRVRRDVDGVAGATITSSAMSLGIRNAARRVAAAHRVGAGSAAPAGLTIAAATLDQLRATTWADLLEARMARQVGYGDVNVSVVYVRDPQVGEVLMGLPFRSAYDALGESVHDRHLMLVGIDGSRSLGPLPRLFFAQGGDTLPLIQAEFMDLGAITSGKLEGVFRRPGLWLVKRSLDLSAPFQVGLRRCCGDPPVSVEYVVEQPAPSAPPAVLAALPAGGAAPSSAPTRSADRAGDGTVERRAEATPPATGTAAPSAALVPGESPASPSAEPTGEAASPSAPPAPTRVSGGSGPTPLIRVGAIFALAAAGLVAVAALAGRRTRRGSRP